MSDRLCSKDLDVNKLMDNVKALSVGNKIAAPLVKVKDAASEVLGKIGSMLKTLAKGVTIAIGVAGAGAAAIMGGSLSQGADLEQSIGGVETLFKDSAGIVKANADAAFQTAGLSANNYMETVTSFSASLLSSLGGDTQKAAQVADMAVVDMSDNANKMGTSMEDIQNAYQGFAKQNYTMLDNLKLGYGGTKEEMQRLLDDASKLSGQEYDISNLSDVYNAVHEIQKSLDITGTTAKEAATTFSGSFNSMKSAAQNLLGNMAIGGDVKTAMSQLVDSAITFAFGNAIPMIQNIFSSLPDVISTAVEKGVPAIKKAGSELVKGLGSSVMNLLPDSMKKVTTSVSNVAATAKQAGAGVGEVASQVSKYVGYTVQSGDTLSAIAKQYKTTYQDLAAYNNIPDPNKIFTGQSIQVPNMEASQQPSQTEAASPQPETTTTTSLNMDNPIISSFANLAAASLGMVQTAFSSLKTAVSAAAGTVVSVLPGITNAVTAVVTGITPLIQTATDIFVAAQPIVVSVINSLSGAVQRLAPPVSTAVNKVGKAIEKLVQTVSNHMGVFETAVSAIVPVISTSISVLGTVFEAAGNVISPALDAILSIVESVMGAIAPVVSDAWSMISSKRF